MLLSLYQKSKQLQVSPLERDSTFSELEFIYFSGTVVLNTQFLKIFFFSPFDDDFVASLVLLL